MKKLIVSLIIVVTLLMTILNVCGENIPMNSVINFSEIDLKNSVIAFFSEYYDLSDDFFHNARFYSCTRNAYGNIELYCDVDNEPVDMVDFEFDSKNNIVYCSYLDKCSNIHYENTAPIASDSMLNQIYSTFTNWAISSISLYPQVEDLIIYLSYTSFCSAPSELRATIHYKGTMNGDTGTIHGIEMAIQVYDNTIEFVNYETATVADNGELSIQPRKSIICPAGAQTDQFTIKRSDNLESELTIYRAEVSTNTFYVVPFFSFADAAGFSVGENMFTYMDRSFSVDRKHVDIMQYRKFYTTGILRQLQNDFDSYYYALWREELYVDLNLLIEFYRSQLGINIQIDENNRRLMIDSCIS